MDVRCSLASLLLFLMVCIGWFEGVLPVCIDDFMPKLVSFGGPATEVRLECSALSDYKWWRSNSCETTSFTEYEGCNNTQMCPIPLISLMEEFVMYFCCTPNNVYFLGEIVPPKCFQIKLCPQIIDFVVPPTMFVGSQERVYISVQASPPPPAQHLTIFLESDGAQARELGYTSVQESGITNSTYVHIFEVPFNVPQGPKLIFEATFNLGDCQLAYRMGMTKKILNNSLPSTCAMSSSSLTVPSSTAVVVLPTPSPTPEACPTTSCTEAVHVPVIPLAVIIAVLLCTIVVIVIGCGIAYHQKGLRCVCATSSDEDSNRVRPTALRINGNIPHRPDSPQYAMISNSSTPYTPPNSSTPYTNQECPLMPQHQNGEQLYDRRHEGNKMTLPDPTSEGSTI